MLCRPSTRIWFLTILSATISFCLMQTEFSRPKGTTYMELFQYAMKDSFPDLTVDMDKLIREYTKFCPYLSECDYDHLKGTPPFTYKRSELSLPECPPCDCSFECMKNDNCCPGSPYQFYRYEIANVTVHSHEAREPETLIVIGHCPAWYTEDAYVINRCQGEKSFLFPASSTKDYLTYRNRYCAECHNKTDLQLWPLAAYCGHRLEKTPIQDAIDHHCTLKFPTENPVLEYFHLKGNMYGRCNVTGLWREYDPDIEWACENMNNKYRGALNVFCYICNPGILSLRSTPLIDECNVTSNWDLHKPEVQQACQSLPSTIRLFPYKNIHCKICNGNKYSMHGRHFRTIISEAGIPSQLNVTLTVSQNSAKEFLEEVHQLLNSARIRGSRQVNVEPKETFENSSDIIEALESACGTLEDCSGAKNKTLCTNKLYCPRFAEMCRCGHSWVDHTPNTCCIQNILKYNPYTCASQRSFPSWYPNVEDTLLHHELTSSYSMIDECATARDVGDSFSMFNEIISSGELPSIPVTIQQPSVRSRFPNSWTMYKNLSYWLCNSHSQRAFMDFELHCNTYIDHTLYRNITHLMQVAREHCAIYFMTSSARHCRRDSGELRYNREMRYRGRFFPKTNMSKILVRAIDQAYVEVGNDVYSTCNQTHKWIKEHKDVKFLCEGNSESVSYISAVKMNGNLYKNFACFLCNPTAKNPGIDKVISTCNVTGLWRGYDTLVERLCNETERHDKWFPFKNYHCSECNLRLWESTIGTVDDGFYLGVIAFGFLDTEWLSFVHSTKTVVTRGNVPAGTHMTLMCALNHKLQNGSCQSAYPERELTYILSFGLRWPDDTNSLNSDCRIHTKAQETTSTTLNNVVDQVTDQILGQIKHLDRNSKGFYANGTADASCDKTTLALKAAVTTISFSLTFGYIGPNVIELEQLLVDFLDSNFSIEITTNNDQMSYCNLLVDAYHEPLHAPSLKHTPRKDTSSCYYSKLLPGIDFLIPSALDTAVVVDRLLLCPQLEFSSNEFHYNNKTYTLSTTDGRMTFEPGYFKLYGTVTRICANHYWDNFIPSQQIETRVLMRYYHVFSYFVIGISLIALALTFATYCLFPSLRSLPGKTIMVLTFCLFIAQACLLLSVHLESNSALCQTMGIAVHYFWLATFFAMNACSFHLFEIFCRNTFNKATSTQENRRFRYYLLYIFGLPLAIVATIICIYAISSNGNYAGYGRVVCFLSDIHTSIAAFLVPAAILFLSNTALFSLAFHKIRTTPNVQSSRKAERKDFVICIRICAIIGITWPLYFVNSLIGFSYFTFVVEGINSLQGLYIFLSYVCNRRILALYKQKFSCNQ